MKEMTLDELRECIYDYSENKDIDIVIDLSTYRIEGDKNE